MSIADQEREDRELHSNLTDEEYQRMCVDRVLKNDWDAHPIIDGFEEYLFVKYSTINDVVEWTKAHPPFSDERYTYEPDYYGQAYKVFKDGMIIGYIGIEEGEKHYGQA